MAYRTAPDEEIHSIIIERDDSQLFAEPETYIEYENDEDYFRQLSRQLYGSRYKKPQIKSVVEPVFKTSMDKIKALALNVKKPDSSSIRLPDRDQITKLLYGTKKPISTKSGLSQQKLNSIRLAYQQLSQQNTARKIKQPDLGPRTHRIRLEDPENLISSRSTLNNSTKSTNKERNIDLYFPASLKNQNFDSSKLFKLTFRRK